MKKMKRTLVLVLALFLLAGWLPTPGASAQAAEPILTVHSPDSLPKAGECFSVTVEISGNPGLCAAQLALVYDRNMLVCTDASLGSVLQGALSVSNPTASHGAVIAAVSTLPREGDGALASFNFTALQDLSAWHFALKDLSLTDGAGADVPCIVRLAAPTQPTVGEPGGAEGEVVLQPDDWPIIRSVGETPRFSDTAGHWSAEYAACAAALGIFNGYPDGTFRPDDTISRADFVTALWRSAGCPAPEPDISPFADVPANAYYAVAVTWAHEQGYVDGTDTASFDPDGALERQAAMKVLFRYNGGVSGMELLLASSYDRGFSDSTDIAPWARAAVYWAYYNGIISGTGNNRLSPQAPATRAEAAKLLVNCLEKSGH